MLNDVGLDPNFRTVLFTIDETVFSREIAPLAGVYPSVYAGAPWWFIDAPDAILRYRRAVSETIGYSRTSGFIDDTRAFCSIPARHDMARRLDANHLSTLVAEHRMRHEDAAAIAESVPDQQPRDRQSTRLNSSHVAISYAVFCLKQKKCYLARKHTLSIPLG